MGSGSVILGYITAFAWLYGSGMLRALRFDSCLSYYVKDPHVFVGSLQSVTFSMTTRWSMTYMVFTLFAEKDIDLYYRQWRHFPGKVSLFTVCVGCNTQPWLVFELRDKEWCCFVSMQHKAVPVDHQTRHCLSIEICLFTTRCPNRVVCISFTVQHSVVAPGLHRQLFRQLRVLFRNSRAYGSRGPE